MKQDLFSRSIHSLAVLSSLLVLCLPSWSQDNSPLDPVATNLDTLQTISDAAQNIPAQYKKYLSAHSQNVIGLANAIKGINVDNLINPPSGSTRPLLAPQATAGPTGSVPVSFGPVPVSNPSNDFLFSLISGFTQSETSSAWCGNNLVVGFNDSGSFLETFPTLTSLSFNGVAVSFDGGRNFGDLTFLNPGPNPGDFLEGDPVVACTSPSRFVYSSLFFTHDAVTHLPVSAVSISTSFSSGLVFSAPRAAVSKSAFTHFLDKDWMAVDPRNSARTYISYTDFDFSGTSTACPRTFRLAIEMVSSSNGGITFGPPVVVKEVCSSSGQGLQGSNIAVASNAAGDVYVAYEFFNRSATEIRVRKSTDHGASFGPEVKIADVVPTGAAGLLQGGFRTNEFPMLAVDGNSGRVYATFASASTVLPDLAFRTYGFGDVAVTSSTDGGTTWSTPTVVSPTPADFAGVGRDQFMPGIAVDPTGTVAVCYYDRRNDPANLRIDRFCSASTDQGSSWSDQQVTASGFLPNHATDALINPFYMGDYDSLTSDFTRANAGFLGAFQILVGDYNPDVFSFRF